MRAAIMATLVVLGLAVARAGDEPAPFHLRDGDRVLFYGDSITEGRHYCGFVETYVVTRHRALDVRFGNVGWGGDRVLGGIGGPIDKRLARDVFPRKPTVMTVMLGMNDGAYRKLDEKLLETYRSGLAKITRDLKKNLPEGARLTLCRPTPYDDVTRPPVFEGGYDQVIGRYGDAMEALAKAEGHGIADLHSGLVAALKRAHATDPALAAKLIPDRVHPGPALHLLMAAALLETWHADPVVGSVELDVAKKAMSCDHSEVQELKADATGLRWIQTDASLPLPLDPKDPLVALALRSSDVVEKLDRAPLRVLGLKPGKWKLSIDAKDVATFAAEDLEKGVNLALLPTPMLDQAKAVHAVTLKRQVLEAGRWRGVQVAFGDDPAIDKQKLDAAVKALSALEDDVVREQRALAVPKPRRFELVPVE